MSDQKRLLLGRLLTGCHGRLSRPARRFLELLLPEEHLLGRMHLCLPNERARVRHSVWISAEMGCWSVLLGNDPDGGARAARERARLALEGLELAPAEVLERLDGAPVWFLALDAADVSPVPGEAARLERTITRLAALDRPGLRRLALLDQLDAALEAGDRAGFDQTRRLLGPQTY